MQQQRVPRRVVARRAVHIGARAARRFPLPVLTMLAVRLPLLLLAVGGMWRVATGVVAVRWRRRRLRRRRITAATAATAATAGRGCRAFQRGEQHVREGGVGGVVHRVRCGAVRGKRSGVGRGEWRWRRRGGRCAEGRTHQQQKDGKVDVCNQPPPPPRAACADPSAALLAPAGAA
eukprot:906720-Prymnesium_polylepis.1